MKEIITILATAIFYSSLLGTALLMTVMTVDAAVVGKWTPAIILGILGVVSWTSAAMMTVRIVRIVRSWRTT